ncbi:MAG: PEP/pyruvate-binding domain-containing protein, partial [Desulfobaccales bacterium]
MNFSQLFRYWTLQVFAPDKLLRHKYASFKELLHQDKRSLELITDLEDIFHGGAPVDWSRVARLVRALKWWVGSLLRTLAAMHPGAYDDLAGRFAALESALEEAVSLPEGECTPSFTLSLSEAFQQPKQAGGKAQALSRVLRETGLKSPRGFIITTNAFSCFFEHNDIRHRLDEILGEVRLDDWERLEAQSQEMVAMVMEGEVPPAVREDIVSRLGELEQAGGANLFSLRSSAVSEDGDTSFAGQYASVLQVSVDQVLKAYKEVLASKYAPRAVAYRIRSGLADQETPMAVLVMEMIEARVSGVVYTRDREAGGEFPDCLAVYAVPGLGHRLVDGTAEPEVHYFSRERPPQFLRTTSGRTCPLELPEKACLSPETAALLAGWGMRLEELNGCPQDIEWCQDNRGTCFLLQARPLVTGNIGSAPWPENKATAPIDLPMLLEGGVTASAGVGAGRVHLIHSDGDLGEVPEGDVLVSSTLSPSLAGVIGRLRAVVAEGGSRASHFASIAREFGIPVLAAAHQAAKILRSGDMVTVDADHGRVHQGEIPGLDTTPRRALLPPEAPFPVRLRKVMNLVSPLHLLNPATPDFSPENCQSVHDFVRFAHEKGMAEMFSLVGRHGRGLARARR